MRPTLLRLTCAALMGMLAAPTPASACILVRPRGSDGSAKPRLTGERVLILYDESARLEHFVRELHVDDAPRSGFGFIVPVPSQPTVARAHAQLFDDLAAQFPWREPTANLERRQTRSQAIKLVEPPVEVVSEQRVGSYTAAVLTAKDPRALQGWLSKNNYQAPKQADAWFDHYVRLGFYFVAFRFEGAPASAKPEAVRISFASAAPFYPYREPEVMPDCPPSSGAPARSLQVWFVSKHGWVPRAAIATASGVRFRNPWSRTDADPLQSGSRPAVLGALSKLLPAGPLQVEVFMDRRTQRVGYGDVVFAPLDPSNAAPEAQLPALAAVLDPAQAGDADAALTTAYACAPDDGTPLGRTALVRREGASAEALALLRGRGAPATIHSRDFPSPLAVRLAPHEGVDLAQNGELLVGGLDGCGALHALADGTWDFTLEVEAGRDPHLVFQGAAKEVNVDRCLVGLQLPEGRRLYAPPQRAALAGQLTVDRAP
jgi:hypothetical protein